MAQTSNIPRNPGVRRRSQRVLMQVPVRVRGTDSQGNPFDEETETLAINAHGALTLINARVTSGSKILLQHRRTQEEQECHVVFLGPCARAKPRLVWSFLTRGPHSGASRFLPKTGRRNIRKPAPSPSPAQKNNRYSLPDSRRFFPLQKRGK